MPNGSLSRLARAALGYAARGWPIYPQEPRGKRPLAGGHGYLDATADRRTVERWWRQTPDANIAFAPGRARMLVIECDSAEALAAAQALGIEPGQTLTCSRGAVDRVHIYYRRPDIAEVIGNVALVPTVPTLELRCDKGGLTVPPSVHPSGALYEWHGRAHGIAELPGPALDALHDALHRHDLSEADRARLLTAVPATGDVARRVACYVATIGNRAEGEGRSNAGYKFACFLVRDVGLDIVTAHTYLAAWNAGNAPPLPERDVINLLRHALKYGRRPVGARQSA